MPQGKMFTNLEQEGKVVDVILGAVGKDIVKYSLIFRMSTPQMAGWNPTLMGSFATFVIHQLLRNHKIILVKRDRKG